MIHLQNVTKIYRTKHKDNVVLDDITADIPTDKNIGILGRNGAGKSTMLKLISRADMPTRGFIHTKKRLSWPMGFSGGFQSSLTAVDNIRFVSRIYGVNWRETVDYVEDFADLGAYLHMPIRTFSSGMRARLNVAMSLAIKFEVYLMDEIPGVGDARFKTRFDAAFADLRKHASMMLISHNPAAIRQHCDIAYLLRNGKLYRYDDIEEALAEYAAV